MRIVEWQEKQSEQGISIVGPTTISRRGEMLSVQAFPMQQGGGMGFIVTMVVRRLDTGAVIVVNGLECKFVDDRDSQPCGVTNVLDLQKPNNHPNPFAQPDFPKKK